MSQIACAWVHVCRGNVPAFTLCQRKGSFWLQWGSHQEAPRYKPRPHSQVRRYTYGHTQFMLSCCVFTLSNCQTNFPIYCNKVSSWVFTPSNLWVPPFTVCLSLCSTSRLACIFSFISPSHVSTRVFLIITLMICSASKVNAPSHVWVERKKEIFKHSCMLCLKIVEYFAMQISLEVLQWICLLSRLLSGLFLSHGVNIVQFWLSGIIISSWARGHNQRMKNK